MKEKAESGAGGGVGYVRADQIDLKSLDEQLQRHLSRAWTMEKRKSLSDGEDNVNNKHNQNNFGHRQLVFQRPLLGGGGFNNNDIIRSTAEVGRSRREWEIDPSKLIIKSVIARGTFGTVHRGIYDGQDVAGTISLSISNDSYIFLFYYSEKYHILRRSLFGQII